MANPHSVPHSDGSRFSDGTGFASVDVLDSDEWPQNAGGLAIADQISALARAVHFVAQKPGRHMPTDLVAALRSLAEGGRA